MAADRPSRKRNTTERSKTQYARRIGLRPPPREENHSLARSALLVLSISELGVNRRKEIARTDTDKGSFGAHKSSPPSRWEAFDQSHRVKIFLPSPMQFSIQIRSCRAAPPL